MSSKKSLTPIECYEKAMSLLQESRREFVGKIAELELLKEDFELLKEELQNKIHEIDELKLKLEAKLNSSDSHIASQQVLLVPTSQSQDDSKKPSHHF